MAIGEQAVAAGLSFALTDEQRALRELAHEFAEREIRPRAAEYDEHQTHPADVLARAHEVGLVNLHIPEGYGGLAISVFERHFVPGEECLRCTRVRTPITDFVKGNRSGCGC